MLWSVGKYSGAVIRSSKLNSWKYLSVSLTVMVRKVGSLAKTVLTIHLPSSLKNTFTVSSHYNR